MPSDTPTKNGRIKVHNILKRTSPINFPGTGLQRWLPDVKEIGLIYVVIIDHLQRIFTNHFII